MHGELDTSSQKDANDAEWNHDWSTGHFLEFCQYPRKGDLPGQIYATGGQSASPAPRLSPSPPPPTQVASARLPESRVNNDASVKACLDELDDAVMSGGIFDERSIMTTSELLRVLSQSCERK